MILNDYSFLEDIKIEDLKKLIKHKKQKLVTTKKRSALMISGHNLKHLNKLDEIKADIVILNLEDGVPKDKKEIAKYYIAYFLSKFEYDKEIVIRVNALDEGGIEEIKFFEKFDLNGFRIPKIKTLDEIEKIKAITDKDIHLSIETKEAFFNLRDFSDERIKVLYLGIMDLLADLNLDYSYLKLDNEMIKKIIIDFSLNSRYLNKIPIGFVFQEYKDIESFKKWAKFEKSVGIIGKGCITPTQVELSNGIFDLLYNNEKLIVERFEKEGPFTLNGIYIDEPIYKLALNKLKEINENI